MAHVVDNVFKPFAGRGIAALVARAEDAIARRRVYHRTLSELSTLTTRELQDLGIARGDIVEIARQAAYTD